MRTQTTGTIGRLAALVLLFGVAAPVAALQSAAPETPQAAAPTNGTAAARTDYAIGIPDILEIAVWEQPDLTGKFQVAVDGSIGFPLIGRLNVAGLTVRDVEGEVRRRLADGYLRNPHVTVTVAEHKSQRIYVVGEVNTPGVVALTGGITLLEALARAGSLSDSAGGDLVVVRPQSGARTEGPVLPGEAGAEEVLRADIRELQTGKLQQNVGLKDGDTILVSRAETIFVLGAVSNPGLFTITRNMTVSDALSLAGGLTRMGADNRIKIIRKVNGKVTEVKVKEMSDPVFPGDRIEVPTRKI